MRIVGLPDYKTWQDCRTRALRQDNRPHGGSRFPAEEIYEYPSGPEILVYRNKEQFIIT